MSDFSKMSIQELAERYLEERKRVESGEIPADLEALENELQKRIGAIVGEIWWNIKEYLKWLQLQVNELRSVSD